MVNNFRTPQPLPQKEYFVSTSAEEYDFNFCFEVPSSLKSNGVELVPLIVSVVSNLLFLLLITTGLTLTSLQRSSPLPRDFPSILLSAGLDSYDSHQFMGKLCTITTKLTLLCLPIWLTDRLQASRKFL